MINKEFNLNCKGNIFCLSTPKIMGIINLTPDSFYDKSRVCEMDICSKVEKMIEDGAEIIDIGGQSTRPSSVKIPEKEEADRVLNPLKTIRKNFPDIKISVDTFYDKIVNLSIEEGVDLINDVSGGNMLPITYSQLAKFKMPVILMNTKILNNENKEESLLEVSKFFISKVKYLQQYGLMDIILDLGFGFGKTLEQNHFLINNIKHFNLLELPMLVGISRKSMLYKPLSLSPEEVLVATTSIHTLALQSGNCHILRVHDVKETKQCIDILNFTFNNK